MTDKIRELRKIVPVPMGEALQLLKSNEDDVEKCVYLFKAKSIKEICQLTGCDEKMANMYYEAEKYDFNRTVSSIREEIYDQNYQPIAGVTKDDLRIVMQWLGVIEAKDFGVSLDYSLLDKVIKILLLISSLADVGEAVAEAKKVKDTIFDGYTDDMSMAEFVRRHKCLDDEVCFQKADSIMRLRMTVIKEELVRHIRNLN